MLVAGPLKHMNVFQRSFVCHSPVSIEQSYPDKILWANLNIAFSVNASSVDKAARELLFPAILNILPMLLAASPGRFGLNKNRLAIPLGKEHKIFRHFGTINFGPSEKMEKRRHRNISGQTTKISKACFTESEIYSCFSGVKVRARLPEALPITIEIMPPFFSSLPRSRSQRDIVSSFHTMAHNFVRNVSRQFASMASCLDHFPKTSA